MTELFFKRDLAYVYNCGYHPVVRYDDQTILRMMLERREPVRHMQLRDKMLEMLEYTLYRAAKESRYDVFALILGCVKPDFDKAITGACEVGDCDMLKYLLRFCCEYSEEGDNVTFEYYYIAGMRGHSKIVEILFKVSGWQYTGLGRAHADRIYEMYKSHPKCLLIIKGMIDADYMRTYAEEIGDDSFIQFLREI